jgi:hypothetical protein
MDQYSIELPPDPTPVLVGSPDDLNRLCVSVSGRFVGPPRDFGIGQAGVFDVRVSFGNASAVVHFAEDVDDVAAVCERRQERLKRELDEVRANYRDDRWEAQGAVEVNLSELAERLAIG